MPISVHRRTPRPVSNEPSMGDQLGGIAHSFISGLNQKNQSQIFAEKVKELTGRDVSGLPPEAQMEFLKMSEQAKNQQELERKKNQFKTERDEQKQKALSEILGGTSNPATNNLSGMNAPNDLQQSQSEYGFDPLKLTPAKIMEIGNIDPNAGRLAQHAYDVALRERAEANKEISGSYKENQKYIDKVLDNYEMTQNKQAIFDRMQQLEQSGELSGPGIVNLLKSLGLQEEWLQNPSNEEYTKLGLDLLGGGTLQADYGSRVLASEFKVSQQRIPTLSQTPEGRAQIRENLETMLLPNKLKAERLQYYLDKSERTGKPLPHNLRGKILQDIKPQLDEVYDKFKQRNGRYTVKQGTNPDDNAIEKYYYLSNGDQDKAFKMMEEDGYNVKSEKQSNNGNGISGGSARIRPSVSAGI